MTPDELKHRTKTFAVEIVKFARKLPNDIATVHIARQLLRSGTSVVELPRVVLREVAGGFRLQDDDGRRGGGRDALLAGVARRHGHGVA